MNLFFYFSNFYMYRSLFALSLSLSILFLKLSYALQGENCNGKLLFARYDGYYRTRNGILSSLSFAFPASRFYEGVNES